LDVQIGGESRSVGSAVSFEGEIRAPFDSDAMRIELVDVGEIDIISREIQMEGVGGGVVGCASRGDGIVMEEMQVVEGDFAVADVKVGIELLNRFAVKRTAIEVDLAFALGIGKSSRSLDEKIGFAGDGITVPGKRLQRGHFGVVQVGAESEIAVPGEMAMQQGGGGLEFRRSVVAAQGGVAQRDGFEGGLDRGGKRIPMGLKGVGAGGRGNVDVKIFDADIARELRGNKRAAQVAVEGCAAIQHHGKQSGATNHGKQWKPIREAGCRNRQAKSRGRG